MADQSASLNRDLHGRIPVALCAAWLRWLGLVGMVLLPAAIYWGTIFHRYGFRDDYTVLRESHAEPGKVLEISAAQGLPLYGLLMEHSFALVTRIDDLQWLRLLSAVLIGTVALALYRLLRRAKWDVGIAALVALVITTLPGAQLVVSWTAGWPAGVALLLSLGAFACAENAFTRNRITLRGVWWVTALVLLALSALVDQANALFYFVPLAAGLWPRRRWSHRSATAWLARHIATVCVGITAAFAAMVVASAAGWIPLAERAGLEQAWIGKLGWFLNEPLYNAFALIALNDDEGSRGAYRAAALAALVVGVGVWRQWETRGWRHGLWWLGAVTLLVIASFGVNLLTADRSAMYRVLLPLTGVICVFGALALVSLGGRTVARIGLAALLVAGALLARRQTFELIAWPQSLELALIERGSDEIARDRGARVFVITPSEVHRPSPRSFQDEFGSLSTDSEGTPKEMLKLALAERQGSLAALPEVDRRYVFAAGPRYPRGQYFDHVIDLRALHEFRGMRPRGDLPPHAVIEGAARP